MGRPLDTTRLSISGVRSRVAVRVAERRDRQVTVEQHLPFLAIGTEIADENGRTGRIARVAVALERGVPKLVLELSYDAAPTRARRDETISYGQDQRPTVPEPLRPARGLRLESADRSLPLQPGASPTTSLAFPLEVRRSPRSSGPFAWLTRFFTR
jgi:hypothetical protein